MFLDIIILAALAKLNNEMDSPWVCTIIYAIVGFVLGMLFGSGFFLSLFKTAMAGVIAFGYFWLLKRTKENRVLWLVITVVGAVGIAFI